MDALASSEEAEVRVPPEPASIRRLLRHSVAAYGVLSGEPYGQNAPNWTVGEADKSREPPSSPSDPTMYPSFSKLRSNRLIARLRSTPRLRAKHEPDSTDRPDRSPRSKNRFL
jgi:hypothetical protein